MNVCLQGSTIVNLCHCSLRVESNSVGCNSSIQILISVFHFTLHKNRACKLIPNFSNPVYGTHGLHVAVDSRPWTSHRRAWPSVYLASLLHKVGVKSPLLYRPLKASFVSCLLCEEYVHSWFSGGLYLRIRT